jgi:hypothetical protein
MKSKIYKPIFIVGCGRSGTTAFYKLLAQHKDLSWISNYSNAFYPIFPPAAGLCSLYNSKFLQKVIRRPVRPIEGYRLWNWCHPVEDSPSDPPLDAFNATNTTKKRCRKLIRDHIKYSKKQRFINKNTRNSRRIKFLNKIFPDALFIHLIRDGRAVAASFLNAPFWNNLKPWFKIDISKIPGGDKNIKLLATAIMLWKTEVSKVLEDKECLNNKRYMEIKYEDFSHRPKTIIEKVLNFCELESSINFRRIIDMAGIKNMNDRYKDRLSETQIQFVKTLTGEFASTIGYNFD